MKSRASLMINRSNRNVIDIPPPEKTIRLGVVGLGHRAVSNVIEKTIAYEDYELIAVCDIRPEVVAKVTEKLKNHHEITINGYVDFGEMLAGEQLDAVAVQVDADKQVPLACRAMEAGCHVMMEVPLAYSMDHCWQLITTVEKTGKVFLLMEQLRYAGYIQAWREIVQSGLIGKPLFAEGEYFNDKPDAFFQTEDGLFYRARTAAAEPRARPTWRHLAPTIGYLPHELSPLLHVLDDRVVKVVGMSVRNRSYRYENIERADMQVALMHTGKDTILRMAVSHTTPNIPRGELGSHWHHIKGSEGTLEWQRGNRDKSKMWIDKWQLQEALEIPWSTVRGDGPAEAAQSGHGGVDYFTFACFADTVLRGAPLEFDVYKAVETAAPAILAAASIEQGSMPLEVPDFRPGPHRRAGTLPDEN